MIEINRDPSRRELFWFGILLAVFVAVAGALVRFKFGAPAASTAIWGGGGALAVLFFLVPPLRRPVYLGWMYAAFPIGWTVSHIVLGAVFFLAVTPVGLLMRLFGHDPMRRRPDPEATSYWEARKGEPDAKRYFRQF